MWIVYDEYDKATYFEFDDIYSASDFVQESDDPLTWRIQYAD